MIPRFPAGSVVKLNGGGYVMTVVDTDECGEVTCVWHDRHGVPHSEGYPGAALCSVASVEDDAC